MTVSQQLIEAIGAREFGGGITTADTYLREFEACLDGACPSNILQSVTPRAWQRLMKRASRTLVYHGDGLRLGDTVRLLKDATLPKGVELPPNSIAWTEVIITTPDQDRDGDILETSGAELDPNSPHLFNHLPCEVVGRVVKQTAQTKKVLTAVLSFMATEFAENVATMYEHGALRTSHGFMPTDWEPLPDESGFHILAFKIMEVSGVSIPSNTEAGPIAFSRNKLTHPLLKEWGRMKFRQRRKLKPVTLDLSSLPASGITITRAKSETCTCSTPKIERAITVRSKAMDDDDKEILVRKLKAASCHFRAIEHHDDSGNEHQELARKADQPLQDMLDQLDSDPAYNPYDSGQGDVPDDDGKSAKAVKLQKDADDMLSESLKHGSAIATSKTATKHIRAMASHAVAHVKSILNGGPSQGDETPDDDGDMGYDGGDPKSFEAQCDAMLDKAIDLISDDGGDALITLAATGSRAGRMITRSRAG